MFTKVLFVFLPAIILIYWTPATLSENDGEETQNEKPDLQPEITPSPREKLNVVWPDFTKETEKILQDLKEGKTVDESAITGLVKTLQRWESHTDKRFAAEHVCFYLLIEKNNTVAEIKDVMGKFLKVFNIPSKSKTADGTDENKGMKMCENL